MSKKFTDEDIINVAKCCRVGNCKSCPLENDEKCATNFLNCVIEYMENESTPTADVQEVKRGYWKFNQHSKVVASFRCSECQTCFYNFGNSKILSPTPYCPSCGARMDGDSL